MNEENMMWKFVMVAICAVVALIGGCNATVNYQDNTAMTAMVTNGANPLDALCAVKPGSAGNNYILRLAK